MMAKVVGLGGVFVKSADAKAWRDWYGRVLGVTFEDYGARQLFAHPESWLLTTLWRASAPTRTTSRRPTPRS